MAFITYPLNNIEYQAEDAELFHCTRNSGVYSGNDFQITVTGTNNNVTIGSGVAWIRNSSYSGKVAACKESTTLSLTIPSSTLDRYDIVALRFDKSNNVTTLVIKEGTAASSPVYPTRSQTETTYELYLYAIRRNAGATAITSSVITDLRFDSNYCGLMADSVTAIDTTAINNQLTDFIASIEDALESVESQSGVMLKATYDTNNNGKVDVAENAENFGNQLPSYYAPMTSVNSLSSRKLEMYVLWETSSDTTSVGAFTVSVSNISSYDGFEFICNVNTGSSHDFGLSSGFVPKGRRGKVMDVSGKQRWFAPTETGFSVSKCYLSDSSSGNNADIVPVMILGYKRVQQ